jgi:hypothetical protein
MFKNKSKEVRMAYSHSSAPKDVKTDDHSSKKRKAPADYKSLDIESEQLSCSITAEAFFDPVCVEPCRHYFEQSALAKWRSQNNTCPTCRIPITKIIEPDDAFYFTLNNRNKDPKFYDQCYLDLDLLETALSRNNSSLLAKFTEVFRASPALLNQPKGTQNRKNISAVWLLAAFPQGREILKKEESIRKNICIESLNYALEEGPDMGASAAYWLIVSSDGLKILHDDWHSYREEKDTFSSLFSKITQERLNFIEPKGENKGKSLVWWLATHRDNYRNSSLEHRANSLIGSWLRSKKITSEALSSMAEIGGKSAAELLAETKEGRDLLADTNYSASDMAITTVTSATMNKNIVWWFAYSIRTSSPNTYPNPTILFDRLINKINSAGLNTKALDGSSALWQLAACEEGRTLIRKVLAQTGSEGLDLNSIGHEGKSILWWLAAYDLDLLFTLKDHITPEGLNARNTVDGTSAFFWLAGTVKGRKFLIENKAVRDKVTPEGMNSYYFGEDKNDSGKSAFWYLIHDEEMLRILIEDDELSNKITGEGLKSTVNLKVPGFHSHNWIMRREFHERAIIPIIHCMIMDVLKDTDKKILSLRQELLLKNKAKLFRKTPFNTLYISPLSSSGRNDPIHDTHSIINWFLKTKEGQQILERIPPLKHKLTIQVLNSSNQSIQSFLTCTTTKKIFFDPVCIESEPYGPNDKSCRHYVERSKLADLKYCPCCGQDIQLIREPDVTFRNLFDSALDKNPKWHEERYFSLALLDIAFTKNSKELLDKFCELFKACPLLFIQPCQDEKTLENKTASDILHEHLLKANGVIVNLFVKTFNAISKNSAYLGLSGAACLISTHAGRELLLQNNASLLKQISTETLQQSIMPPNSEHSGKSITFWFQNTKEGKDILKQHPILQNKIILNSAAASTSATDHPDRLFAAAATTATATTAASAPQEGSSVKPK